MSVEEKPTYDDYMKAIRDDGSELQYVPVDMIDEKMIKASLEDFMGYTNFKYSKRKDH